MLLCSCGSPEPKPIHIFPEGFRPPPPKPQPGPAKVQIITLKDMAEHFGVHVDYLTLGSISCARRRFHCKQSTSGLDVTSCQIVIAKEWCKTNDCSQGFMDNEPEPCVGEVARRECDDLDRPVECAQVQAAGLTLIPNAWPKGLIVDPMPLMN